MSFLVSLSNLKFAPERAAKYRELPDSGHWRAIFPKNRYQIFRDHAAGRRRALHQRTMPSKAISPIR
jgi:hypothetical protein